MLRASCTMLLFAAAACAGAVSSTDVTHVSAAYEPPQGWESAVLFQFMDSTYRLLEGGKNPANYAATIEYFDGIRTRVVTGGDIFRAENGSIRTPWYRLEPEGSEYATTIRITISDAAGEEAVAEYPLTLRKGQFYFVEFGVYTRTYGPGSRDAFMQGWRRYPVPPGARRAPGDSLWVAYRTRGRDCFNCPS